MHLMGQLLMILAGIPNWVGLMLMEAETQPTADISTPAAEGNEAHEIRTVTSTVESLVSLVERDIRAGTRRGDRQSRRNGSSKAKYNSIRTKAIG